ncbi:hypothetical protein G9P44_004403 [Scheffersomyces stipitis]|nr:hypothetical protein G9P44_004403 [Scheffersomyces stipitis]
MSLVKRAVGYGPLSRNGLFVKVPWRTFASKSTSASNSASISADVKANSPQKSSSQPSEHPQLSPEDAKREAAKLAAQALKDVGSLFSSGSDDATQPIDTEPIFKNPQLFAPLSLLHQGQVLKELQDKYDKKWTKLTQEDKKLGYYIAYGDWGVREEFKNWKTLEAPYDLPFRVPSEIKSTNPSRTTVIKKLTPEVILGETPIREKQFDYKKMDGVTKFFIYMTSFIVIAAIFRDKKIGEEGKPEEIIIEDPYEKERQLRAEREAEEERIRLEKERLALERSKRKWYYLYLK